MKPLILVAGLFISLLIAVVVVIQLVRVPQMFAVKGEAEIFVVPDTALIVVGVGKNSANSNEASSTVAQTMTDVLAAIKSEGLKEEDITSREIVSAPVMHTNDSGNESQMKGYYARQAVLVRVKDQSKIGPLLLTISKAGSNYWNVSYEISNLKTYEAEVQKAAVEDAVRKADLYAVNGNFKRGKVLKLQESSMRFPNVNYGSRDYEIDGTSWSGGAIETVIVTAERRSSTPPTSFTVPAPEKQSISADVSVLFELD